MADTRRYRRARISMTMLPYRSILSKEIRTRGFGTELEPRYIFGAGSLDQ